MRILLACTVLVRLADVAPHFRAFLTDDGVLPRRLLFEHTAPSTVSLYFLSGSPAFAIALLIATGLAAIAFLIGFRTRAAAAACWVLYLSLAVRNPYITSGGDLLASLLLFWSMFLPVGATFSVDAAVTRERANVDQPHLSVATAGVLLQALYVYFFGALLKTGEEWTVNGSAVYAALHLETTATHLAHWLREHLTLTHALTVGVYWIELLSPLLLFSPFRTAAVRTIVLPFYVFMHLGFMAFLSISNFWLASISSLACFAPGLMWNWVGARYWRDRQRHIVIHYDGDCGFCERSALILREFFLPHEVAVIPAQGEIRADLERRNSWVVSDWNGQRRYHWDALTFVVSQSLWAKPIALALWAYGAVGLGRPTYDLIGRHRQRLGGVTRRIPQRAPLALSRGTQALLALVIVFCLGWNIRIALGSPAIPPALEGPAELARALGLRQRWGMFAPRPQLTYVVPVVEGRTSDGRSVDALNRRLQAPSYEWPRYPIDAVPSGPWRKYFNVIGVHSEEAAPQYFRRYATYVCNSWNRSAPAQDRIESLTLTLLVGRTLSAGRSDRSGRRTYSYICPQPPRA